MNFRFSQFLSVNLEYYNIFVAASSSFAHFYLFIYLVDNIPNYFRFKSVKIYFP